MNIPPHLLRQIEHGRVCLVIGAGCSLTSSNGIPKKIPTTEKFCEIVCAEAGLPYSGESPKDVFQAVRSPHGPLSSIAMKELFVKHFTDCLPSPEMNKLVGFSWRRIYTFNIDDVIRNTRGTSRVQRIFPINAMREGRSDWKNFTECQVIHLHGVAGEYENGVIFSRDEYAKEIHKKGGWYENLGEDFSNHTLLVIGSSLDEPILDYHINTFSQNYNESGKSYIITPSSPSPIRKLSLENSGFVHIEGTVSSLVDALGQSFPNGLPPAKIVGSLPVSSASNLSKEDIEGLRSFYPVDLGTIRKLPSFQARSETSLARKYFDGYGPDAITVASNIPAALSQDEPLKKKVVDYFSNGSLGACILGEAGSGKSTFTYRALLDIEDPKDTPVYLFRESASPLTVSLLALERYLEESDKSFGVVLVDDLHIYAELLGELYSNNRLRKVRILTSARKSEWHSRIRRAVGPDMRTLDYQRFATTDIDEIVDKLSSFYPSPSFTRLSREEKYASFAKSRRQLLVALREATSSEVFDDTIRDEFERIESEDGRLLLAIICWATVARVGISVGACQSVYAKLKVNKTFQDAKTQLEGIIGQNSKGRLVARHELYANYIVDELLNANRLTQTLEAYFQYFSGFEMPVIQRVDRIEAQLFKYTLSNKNIYRIFQRADKVDAGVGLFERYSVDFQLDGHFWLQQALYLRRLDRQSAALKALEVSVEAYSDNIFARHALAQQRLIVASLSNSYGEQERRWISDAVDELREQHEMTATTPWRANSEEYPIVTLANHHVDALYSLEEVDEARRAARKYFNEIERFARDAVPSGYLEATRERLMRFSTVGIWDSPSRKTGHVDFV